MYIKTISNFLEDIEYLEHSFDEWCGKDDRCLKKINDCIESEGQLTAAKVYLEYLKDNKNNKIILPDGRTQEVKL